MVAPTVFLAWHAPVQGCPRRAWSLLGEEIMRLGILSFVVLVGCSGGSAVPDGACPGSDPDCNDASQGSTPDASTGQSDSNAPDAMTITDAGADTTDAADALCVLLVDDAGVSHGCGPGDNGPGDHDDGGGAAAPPPSDAAVDASNLPLGASCLDNAQCASDICFFYQVRGTFCTQRCWTNGDCPPPANGCNGMGVCRFGDGG